MKKEENLLKLVSQRIDWDTFSYIKKEEIKAPTKKWGKRNYGIWKRI